MWIKAELAAKLEKVADYLLDSIEQKNDTLVSLETKIAEKTVEIDTLKILKRDLEIETEAIVAKNKNDRAALEASFNREKRDINHLISLNEQTNAQKAEHDKKMLELKYREFAIKLEEDFNKKQKLKALVEERDVENKALLAFDVADH